MGTIQAVFCAACSIKNSGALEELTSQTFRDRVEHEAAAFTNGENKDKKSFLYLPVTQIMGGYDDQLDKLCADLNQKYPALTAIVPSRAEHTVSLYFNHKPNPLRKNMNKFLISGFA